MATWLTQSTAVDIAMGPFVDDNDGKTAETALTITQADIRLKKNGGNWAQKSAAQTLSHEEAGWYECNLSTTDTDTLGILVVAIHESGALPVWREFMVVAANVYDSLIGGGDVLDVSTTQFNGSAVVQSGGRPEVNTTHAAGTAWGSGAITAAAIAPDAIGASELAADAANEIADALLDRAAGVETGLTFRQWLRLAASALFSKASGLETTTAVYRDFGDTKDRITATVDVNGNRSAVTRDAT